MSQLLTINVTHEVLFGDWTGSVGSTGIDKRPVAHRVRLFDDHVDGDSVLDTSVHGGREKAVYAYAAEDAAFWRERTAFPVGNGSFGENLTTLGVDCTNAVIGEKWRIGDVVLQVVQPRFPCVVFAGFWDHDQLVKEFTAEARPGVYLAILQEGSVGAGDVIEVFDVPTHGVTIGEVFRAKSGERALIPHVLQASLPADLREKLEKLSS